jgi:hypothetical protein
VTGSKIADSHTLHVLQDDEMITSMVSTHHGAQTSETAEQAASAIELLSVVYRMYMQRLSEVYPEVRLPLYVATIVGHHAHAAEA